MKYIALIFISTFLVAACANNGGPFDDSFWTGKVKDTTEVVTNEVVEVVDEVTSPEPKKEEPVKHWNNNFTKCWVFDDNGKKADCPME